MSGTIIISFLVLLLKYAAPGESDATTTSVSDISPNTATPSGNTCICPRRHWQQMYCLADFAMLILIDDIDYNTTDDYIKYKFVILRRDKTNKEALLALTEGHYLYIPNSTEKCGVIFEKGLRYAVTGYVENNRLLTNRCWFSIPASELKATYYEGAKFELEKCCSCKILPCDNGMNCSSDVNSCIWDVKNDTMTTYGMCNKLYPNGEACSWHIRTVPQHNVTWRGLDDTIYNIYGMMKKKPTIHSDESSDAS